MRVPKSSSHQWDWTHKSPMQLKRTGHRVSCNQVCRFHVWCYTKSSNKSLTVPVTPPVSPFLAVRIICYKWTLSKTTTFLKSQFISVSKTVTANKACLGQVKMCTCFTLEIQFQIFSAVSLASSRNTFKLLNIFLYFATFLTFFITAPKKDAVLWMEVKITLNISNYSLFT